VVVAVGTGGARVGAGLRHRADFFSRWGHAQWMAGWPCADFFSWNVKRTGRFETDANVDMLHA
jgi:hypothetical protein